MPASMSRTGTSRAPPFAPWDRRELPGLFGVEETARRVGNYKWLEMRLFEALGGWVATVPELDVKLVLGRHCYHHAWHAELWDKRLPELREMNTERLTLPPNDEMVAFVDAMREPEAPELTDREARRRLPGADPADDRGVHVPPERHEPDHRRADASGRSGFILQDELRGLARGRDAPPVADRDARRGGAGGAAASRSSRAADRSPPGGIAGPGTLGEPRRRVVRPDRGSSRMKKILPPEELARDSRFVRVHDHGHGHGPPTRRRSASATSARPSSSRDRPAAADRARQLMHGIFTGEIQALEGAGRTTFDFDDDEAPFAAQARHGPAVLGRVPPLRDLGEARRAHGHRDRRVRRGHVPLRGRVRPRPAPAPDRREPRARGPRHRRVQHDEGVRRRSPATRCSSFCEDWMLADEVTHVKMGSDWLRRLTENDPERRDRALEFQRTVDKLFSLGGFRGETDENPIQLARKFREHGRLHAPTRSTSSPRSRSRRRPRPTPAPPPRADARTGWGTSRSSRPSSPSSSTTRG